MGLLSKIWNPGSLVIIHLELTHDGMHMHASKVSLKKNSAPESESFPDLESVVKKFGKSIPYVLHVDGTGVLTRLVEFVPGYREQLIVNGDKDDFYFCAYEDSYQVAVSFFRKSLIQEQMAYFRENKILVTGITCGIIPVLNVCSANENMVFDYSIRIENDRIKELKRTENVQLKSLVGQTFKSREEAIREGICMDQSQGSEQFSGGLEKEQAKAALAEYEQFSKFRFFGILIVSVILLSLIGNYFYLNRLNNQTAQLETDLLLNNDNLSLLERLKQEKLRKEQLIASSGVNAPEFISFYVDEIGSSVPASISLTEALIFPLKEKLKEKKKVEIDQQLISIAGFTPGSETLDDWMEKMNRFEWVESVELINYLKTENSNAEFKLIITLNQ